MVKLIYKLALAAALLVVILLVANPIYTKYFFKKDVLESKGKILFDLDSLQYVSDVLYFGESSDFSYLESDTCHYSISEMIDTLSSKKVGRLSTYAQHAGSYLQLIKNIKPDSRVKTIIVTLNMRSFNAGWIYSKLETPLMKTNVFYGTYPPIIRRMQVALNGYDNTQTDIREKKMKWHMGHDKINVPDTFRYKNINDWDYAVGSNNVYGYYNPDGSWNVPKIELACHFVKTYAFSIDVDKNPRIADFDNIVKEAKKKNLNVVFNLLAENTQYADSLVGPVLVDLMRQNRDLLVKRYTAQGAIVVNNLELVDGKDYIDQNWTTEHYNQTGRWNIARNVVGTANKWLK